MLPRKALSFIIRSEVISNKPIPISGHFLTRRHLSSNPSDPSPTEARTQALLQRKKVRTVDIGTLKRKGKPITVVTAYDYPSALHVDLAGFDILLVGDSLGMVELVSFIEHLNKKFLNPKWL